MEYNFPFDWSDTHIHWRIKLYYYQRARTHIHAYTYTHGRNEWNIMNKKIRLTDIDRLTRTSIECYSSNPPYWKAALSHYNSSWKKSCIWISIREHQFWTQNFFWFFGCVSFFGSSSFSSFCQTVQNVRYSFFLLIIFLKKKIVGFSSIASWTRTGRRKKNRYKP